MPYIVMALGTSAIQTTHFSIVRGCCGTQLFTCARCLQLATDITERHDQVKFINN